jgi:hypothetical protein
MVHQSCFGQTFGMEIYFSKSFQDSTLLQKTKASQWPHSFKITTWSNNFTPPPLSSHAYQEYLALQEVIQQTQITTGGKDQWKYLWGDDNYTSSKFYNFPYKNVQPPSPVIWIWNSSCSNKIKIFTWPLLMDRLNVRNILKRKKQKLEGNNYNCPLCSMGREETTFHLFFSCPFSQQCWSHLNIN